MVVVNDEVRQLRNWKQEESISKTIITHEEECFDLLSAFKDTWDGYLRRIFPAKHKIELTSESARSVRSPPYRAGPKACQFAAREIAEMMND